MFTALHLSWESSEIEGNVVAEDVVIRGRVIGSIRGVRVILQSTCHIEGDLVHASLAIEQGAYFEGNSRRSENPLARITQYQKSLLRLSSMRQLVGRSRSFCGVT